MQLLLEVLYIYSISIYSQSSTFLPTLKQSEWGHELAWDQTSPVSSTNKKYKIIRSIKSFFGGEVCFLDSGVAPGSALKNDLWWYLGNHLGCWGPNLNLLQQARSYLLAYHSNPSDIGNPSKSNVMPGEPQSLREILILSKIVSKTTANFHLYRFVLSPLKCIYIQLQHKNIQATFPASRQVIGNIKK